MAIFKSNSYSGRYLQLTVTEKTNPANNSSTLSWTLTSTGGTSPCYTISETTVKINGTQVYHIPTTSWSSAVFPAATGSVSGSIEVAHDSTGAKTVDVVFITSVYVGYPLDYGGKMELTKLDRAAPTVSFSVSNITTSGFKISATASTKCDRWYYSLDNGATWTSFSTTDATSASKSIAGMDVNTSYKVKVKARRTYNYVEGTSSAFTVKTLGHAIANLCPEIIADAATVTIIPNVTVYEASFTETVVVKNGSDTLFQFQPLSWSAGTANRTLTLSADQKDRLLKAMSKSSLTLKLYVQTYDGSNLVGTSVIETVKAKTTNENSAPSWASPYLSWEDTSDYAEATGAPTIMVQGKSNLVVTAIGVTARNYAEIANYTVTIGEKTVKSTSPTINVGTIAKSGDLTMRLTVTDTRGHSKYIERTVTVLSYTEPKLKSITLRRANSVDAAIQLSFTASISVVKPDGNSDVNTLVDCSYRYKLTSAGDELSNYSNAISITSGVGRSSSGTSLTFATNELISLDPDHSYDIRLVIIDKFGSSVTYHVIPKGIPCVAIRKDKVGINNSDPKHALDVVGGIGVTGGLFKDGRDVIGDTGWLDLGLSDKVGETVNKEFGRYTGCAYRVVSGNHVYVAFNVSASLDKYGVVVSGTALPSKYRPAKQIYSFAAIDGASAPRIARTYVSTTGHVYIDWARNIGDASASSESTVAWIDGYIDYWI